MSEATTLLRRRHRQPSLSLPASPRHLRVPTVPVIELNSLMRHVTRHTSRLAAAGITTTAIFDVI